MSIATRRVLLIVFGCVLMVGMSMLGSASASAEVIHNFEFDVNGQETPTGTIGFNYLGSVALDQASGDVWIVEWNTGVLYKFDAAGNYTGVEIKGAQVPQGSLGVTASSGIAVDNSSGLNKDDLYVAGTAHDVVYKFDSAGKLLSELTGSETLAGSFQPRGVAVDDSGDLYVADGANNVVDKFEATGKYLSQIASPEIINPATIAVDSAGNVYLTNMQASTVKLEPGGGASVLDSNPTSAVAVDPQDDHVYVAEPQPNLSPGQIAEYDPSGNRLGAFGREQLGEVFGIAVRSSTGEVYVANYGHNLLDVFGPAIVIPDTMTDAASNIQPTGATLNGAVDPDAIQVTGCQFEYATSTSYGQSVPCEQALRSIGSGTSAVAVGANLSGLSPDATYHFRLVATNTNGTNHGADTTFTTTGPPRLDGVWASNVTSTSATLDANINPLWPTNAQYHLEYGTTSSYGHTLAGNAGQGTTDVLVDYHLQELQPDTTYHYRFVTTNVYGTVEAVDHTFTTEAVTGQELTLPDGRAWELVSPPSKSGALIEGFQQDPIQAAYDGRGITYGVLEPIGENIPAGKTVTSQALSMRSPGGWGTQDISLPRRLATEGEISSQGWDYRLFSSDLSIASIQQKGAAVPLSSDAAEDELEGRLYLRNDVDGSFLALLTSADVPAGTKLNGESWEDGNARQIKVEFVDATPDVSHVIMSSGLALTPEATESEFIESHFASENLYEWSAGRLQLVNILPDGHPILGENLLAGERNGNWGSAPRAVSSDGRWVAWIVGDPYRGGLSSLYVRDMVAGKTVQVGGSHPVFQTMSSDGGRIFFTEAGDLYEFDRDTGVQTDLTAEHGMGENNAGVQQAVAGVSEDGSYVYFVANGVLASGATRGDCTQGALAEQTLSVLDCNLYVEHYDSEPGREGWEKPSFIASLSGEDEQDWYSPAFGQGAVNLAGVRSRVSPDGRYLAFMSSRSLTGYDNIDVNSGHPDQEVYLYDASTGHLVCASCDPTGARPVGIFDTGDDVLMDRNIGSHAELTDHWVAGIIPGWGDSSGERSVYQPRYLSDSGRLFFDSPDALVAQDTNGLMDVYEYEPAGVGGSRGCSSSSFTFGVGSDGCVSLISSGTSSSESAFFDASENGDDVFFLTTARLTGADYDTSVDVYDAHVCSDAVPCVVVPVSPPACTSGDSCKAAPSPQPAIFGAAPSATFSGVGNIVEGTKKSVKGKAKTKKHPKKKKKKKMRRKRTRKGKKAGGSHTGRTSKKGQG
jgi:hypothetical protein